MRATLWEQYLPKLVTVWREGYTLSALRADAVAGLTVAIVALPLSMAIAIASGVGPERGLYTAIIGGFLVSALGGSRYQIGGPAGAFIVLVGACVADIGIEGLILATFLSGFMLMGVGLARLGGYIKFIPYPVIVGFTAGIAVIILASQMRDLMGLDLHGAEPAALVPKIEALWGARTTVSGAALALSFATILVIWAVKRWRPGWPALLIAVVLASVAGLPLGVETIAGRFGELPRLPPFPALPDMALLQDALPYAASFTLLGAIESLLSAVVADAMSGTQHRSNAELVAQGVANIGSACFGGFCVTGTIARTATNVRAGSRGPVSGMLHSLYILAVMILAAPLAGNVPLAALAAVLVVVAWGMAEKAEFWALLRASRGDAMVLLATFLLVIFRDLTEGIVVGFALGGLVFIRRMSDAATLHPHHEEAGAETLPPDVLVYRITGAYFFGAAAMIGSVLDRIASRPRVFVLDLDEVPVIDSTGARSLWMLARKLERQGGQFYVTGASPALRPILAAQGLRPPLAQFHPDVAAALAAAGPASQDA